MILHRAIILLSVFTFLSLVFNIKIKDIYSTISNLSIDKAVIVNKNRVKNLKIAKSNFISKYLSKLRELIYDSNLNYEEGKILVISISLMLLGVISGLALSNILVSVVFGLGLFYAPLQYLTLLKYKYQRKLNGSINYSLSLITNSYIQTEDIVLSVKSNINRLPYPIKSIFLEFLTNIEIINPDINYGITIMKSKISNSYFSRWCDLLIQCQHDRDYANVLPAIVSELSDTRRFQVEYDLKVKTIYKDYLSVLMVLTSAIPILRVLNVQWYQTLMQTIAGKLIVAICLASIFITSDIIIKQSKPISY